MTPDSNLNAWIESVSGANEFEHDEDSVVGEQRRDCSGPKGSAMSVAGASATDVSMGSEPPNSGPLEVAQRREAAYSDSLPTPLSDVDATERELEE